MRVTRKGRRCNGTMPTFLMYCWSCMPRVRVRRQQDGRQEQLRVWKAHQVCTSGVCSVPSVLHAKGQGKETMRATVR